MHGVVQVKAQCWAHMVRRGGCNQVLDCLEHRRGGCAGYSNNVHATRDGIIERV